MKRALALLAALSTACSDPAPGASDATLDAAVDASADAPVKPDAPAFSCPRVRPATPPATRVCNGSAAVCARRFDEVSWLTSHNAMSSEARSFASPNQHETITAQLQRGVRGLMLDVHPWHDDVWLCHGTCLAGAQRHVEGLCEVAQFLDANPTEVVTIIYESYVPGASVVADLRAVGLDADAHTQRAGDPWPTVNAMVDANRRLVVLTDREGGAAPWYMPVWDHAQENPYEARTPADLSCAMNRGRATNPLFILNHFLTNPLASPELARTVNFNPVLRDHADRCQRERMRRANFVTLDFVDLGDGLAVTRALNE